VGDAHPTAMSCLFTSTYLSIDFIHESYASNALIVKLSVAKFKVSGKSINLLPTKEMNFNDKLQPLFKSGTIRSAL
jgi:hypothetical protein